MTRLQGPRRILPVVSTVVLVSMTSAKEVPDRSLLSLKRWKNWGRWGRNTQESGWGGGLGERTGSSVRSTEGPRGKSVSRSDMDRHRHSPRSGSLCDATVALLEIGLFDTADH